MLAGCVNLSRQNGLRRLRSLKELLHPNRTDSFTIFNRVFPEDANLNKAKLFMERNRGIVG
jgi:hypothetical protein